MQSPAYQTQYRTVTGKFNQSFFRGLYQGFGPTIITGAPASAAFFTIYESLKVTFQDAKSAGHLSFVPLPVLYGISSAAADLVSCAITNPAEVLKQNAQVHHGQSLPSGTTSPTLAAMKYFSKQPKKLWAGYTALAATRLPATTLSFSLYEMVKDAWLGKDEGNRAEGFCQIYITTVSGAVCGGISMSLFVPVDVVKTRMRLAAGNLTNGTPEMSRKPPTGIVLGTEKPSSILSSLGPLAMAKNIVRNEGIAALFRGTTLTFVGSAMGWGFYLGCYEACKIYLE
ncbi:hypothetical protein CSOJ01_04285 [Colletotrichum sojae]|uniref:Mitochondrial carrier protein n=1 Tax=Colletotrichum sojae TaxID=2175907 RepID=A0A8H6MYT9_9PEZI|nr:hypothetical protein CSOJ01_04285 [Colletotrichum sojae]